MFKNYSLIFFKKIILLSLLSFSFLLITINIPTPFGGGDKISSFEIKQQSLYAEPSETQKQAVWTFLKSQNLFPKKRKKDFTNWLDLIQKRKPQKTALNSSVNFAVDLRPLWSVDKTIEYSNLSSKVKRTLADLSKISYTYNRLPYWNYKKIIQITLATSFQKEKRGAAYDLINTLKSNSYWNDLKNYQIKKIADVDITPLLLVQNIASLSNDKATYNAFPEPVKVSLRNLLDLDVNFALHFNGFFNQIFSKSSHYNSILNALETRIDNVIKRVKKDGKDLWEFLKVSNRLNNIPQFASKRQIIEFLKANSRSNNIQNRKIPRIAGVDISHLHDIDFATTYENLDTTVKGILYDLLQVSDYKVKISNDIKTDANIKTFWDTFLTQNNRFTNLQIYQINTINDTNLTELLKNITISTSYKTLTFEQRMILRKISVLKSEIDDEIQIQKNIQIAISNAWTFLTTNNRLKNLQQYNLNPIKSVSLLLILFQDVAPTVKYINLTKAQKTLLYNLSQVKSYQSIINDQITKAKKSPAKKTPQKKKVLISDVWKFLQNNNRLQQLQTKKTLKTKKFDLSALAKIKPNTKYKDLTLEQNKVLYALSQRTNYQNEIKKVLNEPITTKTKDSSALLLLWITLPLSLVVLIFGLGFYLYHFKKLSIFKFKKRKE